MCTIIEPILKPIVSLIMPDQQLRGKVNCWQYVVSESALFSFYFVNTILPLTFIHNFEHFLMSCSLRWSCFCVVTFALPNSTSPKSTCTVNQRLDSGTQRPPPKNDGGVLVGVLGPRPYIEIHSLGLLGLTEKKSHEKVSFLIRMITSDLAVSWTQTSSLELRDLRSENVNTFIGFYYGQNVCGLLMAYWDGVFHNLYTLPSGVSHLTLNHEQVTLSRFRLGGKTEKRHEKLSNVSEGIAQPLGVST